MRASPSRGVGLGARGVARGVLLDDGEAVGEDDGVSLRLAEDLEAVGVVDVEDEHGVGVGAGGAVGEGGARDFLDLTERNGGGMLGRDFLGAPGEHVVLVEHEASLEAFTVAALQDGEAAPLEDEAQGRAERVAGQLSGVSRRGPRVLRRAQLPPSVEPQGLVQVDVLLAHELVAPPKEGPHRARAVEHSHLCTTEVNTSSSSSSSYSSSRTIISPQCDLSGTNSSGAWSAARAPKTSP
mmetsp:Transcript_8300/g.25737  ORF Transcript_8300/g.25737 Transcript_8300/m.25737 type:complete len:239 (+) Transcript_8300:155-871(+)